MLSQYHESERAACILDCEFISAIEYKSILTETFSRIPKGDNSRVTSSSSPYIKAKKRMIQTIVERSKYIDDKNFLKPVKKKSTKQAKTPKRTRKHKRTARAPMTLDEYQHILDRLKQERAERALSRKSDDGIPRWAKLAAVSEVPNK